MLSQFWFLKPIETIVDSVEILWLNGKHIEERSVHKNLRTTTVKCLSDHKKDSYEPVDEPKINPTVFIKKQSAIKVIMDCKTQGLE